MPSLAECAAEIGGTEVVWVENHLSQVEGYMGAMETRTKGLIRVRGMASPSEARRHIEKVGCRPLVMDIKLHARTDGISFARGIMKRYGQVPIRFVTSYRGEYEGRLNGLGLLGSAYDRDELHDEVFRRFTDSLADDAYAHAVIRRFRVAEMPVDEFLDSPRRGVFLQAHARLYRQRAMNVMSKRGWKWVVFCGDRVVRGSSSNRRFPDFEQKLEISQEYGRTAFTYTSRIESEEREATGDLLDHYPRVAFRVVGRSGSHFAPMDFDTGTNRTLIADVTTEVDPLSIPETDVHFNMRYTYWVNRKSIRIKALEDDEADAVDVELPVAVVKDWGKSPWVLVNPQRLGLLGRDVFAETDVAILIRSVDERRKVVTKIVLPVFGGSDA